MIFWLNEREVNGEPRFAGAGFDLDSTAVPIDDNAMNNFESKSRSLARRLGGEEWFEEVFARFFG